MMQGRALTGKSSFSPQPTSGCVHADMYRYYYFWFIGNVTCKQDRDVVLLLATCPACGTTAIIEYE